MCTENEKAGKRVEHKSESDCSTLSKLLARATELEGERCGKFPHLICTETPNLKFHDLCESCQARVFMQKWRESNAADEGMET